MGVFDMLNPALVLKLRLVIYCVLIFFSFFIFVGTAVMRDKADLHDDACPLYLGKNSRGHPTPGPDSNCNYPMAISIMFQLLYLLFRVGTLVLVLLGKFTPDMVLFSDLAELIYVIVDMLAFFLIFIAACILSAGTNDTCDTWNCDNYEPFSDAKSASKAAQAGAWISTFLWLFIGICGFITLWRSGKIPFLPGGGAAKSDASTTGPDPNQPPIETPPNNPDDPPKY